MTHVTGSVHFFPDLSKQITATANLIERSGPALAKLGASIPAAGPVPAPAPVASSTAYQSVSHVIYSYLFSNTP